MPRYEVLRNRILSGRADANIDFADLRQLLIHLGFDERVSGSHHIFRKPGVEERINLQRDGHQAKPYQVRQVRSVIVKYGSGGQGVMLNYEIILYWSAEDGVFVAEVPELPGCSAHGATQHAALDNAQKAMQLWIDTAVEFGDPVPEPKGRRLIFA